MSESNAGGLTPGFGDKLRGLPIPPWVVTETIDGQVYYIGVRWQNWTEEVDSMRTTITDEKTGKPWLKPIAGGEAPVCEWIARQIQQVRDLDLESLDS